jgi:hypothetical protein
MRGADFQPMDLVKRSPPLDARQHELREADQQLGLPVIQREESAVASV